jgi:hypothetical protein
MEPTGVPGENHRPAAINWQMLSHNVASSTPRSELESNSNVSGDRHWFEIQLPYDHDHDGPICLSVEMHQKQSKQLMKIPFVRQYIPLCAVIYKPFNRL